MEQLINIALKHSNPELDNPNVTNLEDKEMKSCDMLHSNALNCVRGNAARGHLLWENKELFSRFKEIIDGLTKDENPVVRFASLYALWSSYNIDKDWAGEKIISLYDETVNSSKMEDKQIADKCLDLWDIMFERQRGSAREVSRKLMER